MNPRWLEGPEASLQQVLDGREERAALQREWLKKDGVLLCLTLNMPGPVKRFPLADAAFEEGRRLAEQWLQGGGYTLLEQQRVERPGGLEWYARLAGDPLEVKACVAALEEQEPLGRLLDLDVLQPDGSKVGREQLGLPPRTCLLCPRPAAECARSRAHGIEAARQKAISIMEEHFRHQMARRVAAQAQRALLHEVACTPKPGLVDGANSGAHRDMDRFTFLDSAAALGSYFEQAAFVGGGWQGRAEELLPHLRPLGLQAERQMAEATGGVNTHKGAIFSMGILCAALGLFFASGEPFSLAGWMDKAGRIARRALGDFDLPLDETAGRILRRQQGIPGVRGEAAAGFPSVTQWGLPALQDCLARGFSWNGACCGALCALLTQVEDTNLLHRGGTDGLAFAREQAAALWASRPGEEALLEGLAQLDQQFCLRDLSPGGCADLLAVTLLAHFSIRHASSFFDISLSL